MAFNADLLDCMPDTITIAVFTGQDANGNDTWSAPFSTRANVQRALRRQGAAGPQDAVGPTPADDGTVIIPPASVTPRSRLTLYDGTVVYADAVTTYRDAPTTGDYVQEITFKEES